MRYNPPDEYSSTPRAFRWVFNKLALAESLGYSCGPVGEEVDYPGWYCVRPVMNLKGMGEGARIEWIDCSTDHLPAGYFWCERFRGEHISVDYIGDQPVLAVLGKTIPRDCSRFSIWEKIGLSRSPCVPSLLSPILAHSEFTNIEYIGGKVIEIQFHHNADFRWGNDEAIPVYSSQEKPPRGQGWKYVNAPDGERLGLFIR